MAHGNGAARALSPAPALRVLQIGKFYAPQPGGMETHLKDLCDGLSDSVDVQVIVASKAAQDSEACVDGLRVVRVGTRMEVAGASVCPRMSRRIRETPADIVHIHLPNPTGLLSFLASGHKGRLIVTYHSDIVRQKVLGKAFEPLLRWGLRRSAAIVATSAIYVQTSPVLSAYRSRCRIIPFGVHADRYVKPDREAVHRIRRTHRGALILSVGRLVYYKGLEYLVRAMKDIPATLLIVGEGPLRESLEAQARDAGVHERVVFLGRVADVVPYYHAADVFVLPSVARSEAFGLVQLEAMACGKPVVNTELASAVPFVSIGGLTGITVPPGSAAALAEAVNSLLEDPESRAAYGRAARLRVEREYRYQVMLGRTLDLYGEVAKLDHGAHLTV